jgi:RND family efflux transporter MFP subunit
MRKWGLRIFLALIVLGPAAGAAFYWQGPIPVEVVLPTRGPAVEAVYGPGTVEPVVMLPIGPKVAGRLARLLADEGDTVSAGQTLAELDNRELAALVSEWESRVRYSESQFKRASELFKKRITTEAALDQARNELDTATAALDRARRQLGEMTLTAPDDGIIVQRDGEVGQLLQPGDTIFWMSCCDDLRITAEIDEEDVARVKPGQKALIRADAFPEEVFEGEVTEITPKGDPVARSFRVRIRLPAGTPLMIGMTADCNIVLAERADALLIPASAVTGDSVWVVEDGKIWRRRIDVGVEGERLVEVISGLSETDAVVTNPSSRLSDGRTARVTATDSPP